MMIYCLAICTGVALAAACGLRVFLPLLAVAIAAHLGWIVPAQGFAWLAGWPALVMLATATLFEIAGYYIPWLDHALDTVASPLAVFAGVLVMVAVLPLGSPEWLRWTLGITLGGGHAAVVQASSVTLRGASGLTTAALANPIVSTFEVILSAVLSVLAIVVPVLAVILLAVIALFLGRLVLRTIRVLRNRAPANPSPTNPFSAPT